MRLGFDIDGVLANFWASYEALLVRLSGRNLFTDPHPPKTWHWDAAAGYTAEEIRGAWDYIHANPAFWSTLQPLRAHTASVARIPPHWKLYAITARPGGNQMLDHTVAWMGAHLARPMPVIATAHKGTACADLRLDGFIDDLAANVLDIQRDSPRTVAMLLSYPYNSQAQGVRWRVPTVESFVHYFTDGV